MDGSVKILSQYFPLNERQTNNFSTIAAELKRVNKVLNLTANESDAEIAMLHFYDTLSVGLLDGIVKFKDKKIIDIGCGGGFPTLPIAAFFDPAVIYALDSTQKKLDFVQATAKLLDLPVKTLFGRAEELSAYDKKRTDDNGLILRHGFDIAVSRGVAKLNILCEWCLPFLSVGGFFIAMKGRAGREEAESAKNAVSLLGGKLISVTEVPIPEFDRIHMLILIEKVKATPDIYPRQNSKIMKNPL